METYQAVQAEKARRRELGVFANWSINTSCFTGKIKCGHCGASYVRNTRKNRAKNPAPTDPEMYTTYGCGTRKKKNGKCIGKDIRESILREKCAEVMGLTEFDEDAFTSQVEKILVPEHGVLVFHMTDGRVIRTEWVSTAKKDAWTAERRAAKGKLVQERQITANSSCFTSRIRCEMCGENYRRQRSKRVDGSFVNVWRCSSSARCKSQSLPEPTLHELAAMAMGLAEFSEDAFRQQIQYISIVDTMWKATTKPSSAQRFLNWYSRNLSAGNRAEDGTAVYTFSPAKYAADNVASGMVQKPGTPTANTAV